MKEMKVINGKYMRVSLRALRWILMNLDKLGKALLIPTYAYDTYGRDMKAHEIRWPTCGRYYDDNVRVSMIGEFTIPFHHGLPPTIHEFWAFNKYDKYINKALDLDAGLEEYVKGTRRKIMTNYKNRGSRINTVRARLDAARAYAKTIDAQRIVNKRKHEMIREGNGIVTVKKQRRYVPKKYHHFKDMLTELATYSLITMNTMGHIVMQRDAGRYEATSISPYNAWLNMDIRRELITLYNNETEAIST